MSHNGSFEGLERLPDGTTTSWSGTCGCGEQWTGPDLDDVEQMWLEHTAEMAEVVDPDAVHDRMNDQKWGL